ncbi:MAG: hypothetical protein IJ206_09255 [Oscillospiraceae bacterium]|nr:hypothetical protein [Oscillospiraceae bacterium]
MFDYRNDEQHNHYIYLRNPKSLYTVKDCQYQDSRYAQYISDLERELETLRNLRQENFQRMQYLYSLMYTPMVKLRRERRGLRDGKVFYYLEEWKVYEDSTVKPEQISRKEYPGTARRQAISDFHAYVKSHPGIQAEMDIEKGRWER